MASLTAQAIKDSYPQILHVDTAGGGNGTTRVPVKDGDNGTTFAIEMSTTEVKATGTFLQTKKIADVTAAGPTNNVDVLGCNIVRIDTTSNNVSIGGFANGVEGQILNVVVINATNNAILKHNATGGTQKVFLSSGADETKTASYGGWRLYCNGTSWFAI